MANFNYAWKLVELPLVLAVQLVASLAFPTIPRTAAGSPEHEKARRLAFSLAWALACAAVAVVVTFSLPLATLLFGWGRKLSTQARELARHYECVAVSFNRRLSTVLASIGRDQLRVLAQQAEQRRRVFERYVLVLAVLPQIHWVPQSDGYRFTRWLTCLTLSGPDVDQRCHQFTKALKRHLIEARPV